MKDNQFTITLENNTEQLCEFLFNFIDEDNNKNYMFFEIVVSGICDVVEYIKHENDELELIPVTDETTREMLNEILEQYNNHEGCNCSDDDTCCGGCK